MQRYNLFQRLLEAIVEETKAATKNGLLPDGQLADAMVEERVSYMVPQAVHLEAASRMMDLSMQWCTKCGRVWDAKTRSDCICGSKASCAPPIWYISKTGVGRTMYTSTARDLTISLNHYAVRGRMRIGSKIESLKIMNYSRPTSSLFAGTNGENIRLPLEVKTGPYKYVMGYPSEETTKPITLTVFAYDEADCQEEHGAKFPAIKKISYCHGLVVMQATMCYRIGSLLGKGSEKCYVYDERDNQLKVYVRIFNTDGIIISADTSAISSAKLDNWTVLHTLSHAFLSPLPMTVGLESSNFAEAIMSSKGEVAVFDNVKGGIGGVNGVSRDRDAAQRLFFLAGQKARCPNECLHGCKACLFTDSCYMLNFGLDRYALAALGW